jgi:hypothetical protein
MVLRNMVKRDVLIWICIIGVFAALILQGFSPKLKKEMSDQTFKGVVRKKYFQKVTTIEVDTGGENSLVFTHLAEPFLSEVEVGDSLLKMEMSNKCILRKRNGTTGVFTFIHF